MSSCPECRRPGRGVSSITVAHNATRAALVPEDAEGWELCLSGEECAVVYFRGDRAVHLRDVRAAPFHKATGPSRTVCFCFGHTDRDLVTAGAGGGPAIRASISEACRQGKSDCQRANPSGRCCLGDVDRVIRGASDEVTTLATLRSWAERRERFNVFTCYDATTARWLVRGGARVLLVGDSAAQWMLGLDRSGRPSLEYMATIGAAVVRGAPRAFVIVDYPDDLTGSFGDHASRVRRLAEESGAGAVKVEASADALRELLSTPQVRSVPIVAHLAYRPGDRCTGEPAAAPAGPTRPAALAADVLSVVAAGAVAVLLQEVAPEAAAEAIREVAEAHPALPVLGCHAGNACVGEVEMLYALLGLGGASSPLASLGDAIREAARRRIAALR